MGEDKHACIQRLHPPRDCGRDHSHSVRRSGAEVQRLGSFIWNALSEDLTLDALSARITDVYEIDAATAKADAEEFLAELRRVGALED